MVDIFWLLNLGLMACDVYYDDHIQILSRKRNSISYSLQNLYDKSMSLHMFHISKDKSNRIYFYTSYISIWRVKNDNSFNLEVLSVLL